VTSAAVSAAAGSDAARRRDLRRMKGLAGALLVVAAVTYLVADRAARGQGAAVATWVLYVRTAAEAGMVGGLADWFAVTALFRRPLGLPIPHTAIIPTRKDSIGRSLGDFVGANFLAADVVRGRIRAAHVAARAGAWLQEPAHAARVTGELARALRAAVGVLRDDDVQAVIDQAITRRLAAAPAGPLLGRVLGEVVADGAHHGLVDLTVDNAYRWLVDNRTAVVDAIARQAPVWSPRFVDERVAERVHAEVLRVVGEIRDDPHHELRGSFDRFLASYARDLQEDRATQERVDDIKARLLDHPEVRRAVGDLGASLQRLLMEAVDDPDSELRARTARALATLGQRLVTEPDLRAKVDGWLEDLTVYVTTGYREELTRVITDTVERWDGRETARRIELQVGPDLQFIRINGTVVGALAGVAIQAVTMLVH
jgi:uncharacterized membrane-anchored protein YjiN (DUF445 family)